MKRDNNIFVPIRGDDSGHWLLVKTNKRTNMSNKKLEIWERARKISIAVHKMTLTELPKFELETLFETVSLKNKKLYDDLHEQLEISGKKLNLFIQSIEATSNQ